VTWREDARAEIGELKPYFVTKYGWAPRIVEPGGQEILDLHLTLTSKRLAGRVFGLRLRYLPDWQVAGRREEFVNPRETTEEGPAYWPPAEGTSVRGINPRHDPPAICLRGTWGYHSVLHADRPMGDSTLLNLLLELQNVFDE
jgi:hypothetical protein